MVTAGEGEPVLFVHGAVGDYRKWDGLWEDVAAGHRFIAYTQRWFGTTAWPEDKPYARDVQDDDLVAILQALGEPVHLVGLSNGGPVVLRAALRVPDLVQSVVVYEPTLLDVLFGTAEGEAVVGEFFAGVADTSAAVEAGDNEEAARELIERSTPCRRAGSTRSIRCRRRWCWTMRTPCRCCGTRRTRRR